MKRFVLIFMTTASCSMYASERAKVPNPDEESGAPLLAPPLELSRGAAERKEDAEQHVAHDHAQWPCHNCKQRVGPEVESLYKKVLTFFDKHGNSSNLQDKQRASWAISLATSLIDDRPIQSHKDRAISAIRLYVRVPHRQDLFAAIYLTRTSNNKQMCSVTVNDDAGSSYAISGNVEALQTSILMSQLSELSRLRIDNGLKSPGVVNSSSGVCYKALLLATVAEAEVGEAEEDVVGLAVQQQQPAPVVARPSFLKKLCCCIGQDDA